MKKALRFLLPLVLIAVFAATLAACINTNEQDATSSIEDSIPSEQQIWLPYKLQDHDANCIYTYYYDEYGNEIKTTKEDLHGNLTAAWLSEYDENHNLIKRSVDTGDGTPFVQLIQTYDGNGKLIEKREITANNEFVQTYRYDEQGRLASKSNGGVVVETYIYEADGSYKAQNVNGEYSLYSADGKIQERHFMPNIKYIYSYDESGNLLECVMSSGENVTRRMVYDLDENGNAIKITQVYASGVEEVTGEYEYRLYTVKAK